MYVMTDAYGSLRLSTIFSASLLLTLVHLVPSLHLLYRQGDWMKTSQCQSLFGCTYPSFLFHVVGRSLLGTFQNKTEVGKFCHSYSIALSQIYPTLHCHQCWLFFQSHFHWLAEVWVWSEHLCRPLSLSVPQSLSLSCVSLKCSQPVYIWGCDPQSLSLHKHSGYAFHLPSMCMSCRLHPWIFVYLVHIQSL